jgi:hypothetical protein
MSVRPGWILLRLALLRSVQLSLLLVGLVWIGSAVESGEDGLSLLAIGGLLAPVSAAAGTAMALAELRRKGEWSAWQGLGFAPLRQVLPLILLVVLGVLGQLSLSSLEGAHALQLPAPVAESARSWPGFEAAEMGQLAYWQRRPAELSWGELQARRRSASPLGSRPGVDLAELFRRIGWVLAWPFGLLAGLGVGLRTTLSPRDRSGPGPLLAAVLAGLGTVGWCLAVLVLSAAQSVT